MKTILKIILFLSMAIASLPSSCMEVDYSSDEKLSAMQQGSSLFDPVNNTDENCAICLDTIELDGLQLQPCDHLFHTACMNQHLGKSGTTCPLCRAEPTNIPNFEQLKKSYEYRYPTEQQFRARMRREHLQQQCFLGSLLGLTAGVFLTINHLVTNHII